LRATARTALTHGLVNGFGWQGTAALLALCCNADPQTFFPCFAFLAHQETLRLAVLHCVAAFQVQQGKPPPLTSHRDRE
jgi:hypothetical protein